MSGNHTHNTMANRKISDLTALTAPATGDLLPIVDISEAAAADKNKKITYGELLASAPLGSAAAPSIAFEGDNTGLFSPGADQLAISTNGTSRIVVDASGNVNIDSNTLYVDAANNRVGLGTSSPASELDVVGLVRASQFQPTLADSAALPGLRVYNETDTGFFRPGSNIIGIATGGTEVARIDSSSRLLVGISSARANFNNSTISSLFQIEGIAATDRIASIVSSTASGATGSLLIFGKQNSGTLGGNTVVASGDNLGNIQFQGSDGTEFVEAASITAAVDGTPGANVMPGRLVFSTSANGASSPTEALRITNDRVLAYNQPTPTSKSAAATLTITELKTGIITYTGTAATLTLPTGTLTEGGFSGIYTNMAFEWSVINTGAGICTIGAGTAHTIVGTATVAIGASARFVSRRTAANTFVSYRLS